jgi:GT2 family glycosyltransferase
MIKKISIVIPVLNGEKTIAKCLDALLKLDFDQDQYEIIVVDNNSTDATKSLVLGYPVAYFFETKSGAAAARNCGARHASGAVLCFVDGDCCVEKDWLAKLMRHFDDSSVSAVLGVCLHQEKSLADSMYIHEYEVDWASRYVLGEDLFALSSANCAIRKDVFQTLGGFDESLLAVEDIDLGMRLFLNGYHIVSDKSACVLHMYTDTLKKRLQKTILYGVYEFQIFKKFENDSRIKMLMPSFFRWYFKFLQKNCGSFVLQCIAKGVSLLLILMRAFLQLLFLMHIKAHHIYRFILDLAILKGKIIALVKTRSMS